METPTDKPKQPEPVSPAPESPPAPVVLTAKEQQDAHQKRMATDREYAAKFLARTMSNGQAFCVTFICVDPFESQKFFEALESQIQPTKEELAAGKKAPELVLINGCKVQCVYSGDIGRAYAQLKQQLAQLAQS